MVNILNKLLLVGLINFSVGSVTPILDITADKLEYNGYYGGPSDPNFRIAYITIKTEFTLSATEKAIIKSEYGNDTLGFKISSEYGYRIAYNVKGEILEKNKDGIGNSSGWTTKFTDSEYLFSEYIYYDTNITFNSLIEESMENHETTFYFKLYFELGNVQLDMLMLSALNKNGEIQISTGSEISTSAEYWKGFEVGYIDGFEEGKGVGYQSGHDDGYDYGYQSGHDDGYAYGYELGKQEGYYLGLNETDATGFVGLLSAVFGGLGSLLAIELLPNIYLGAIIAVPLVFGVLFFILGKRKGD